MKKPRWLGVTVLLLLVGAVTVVGLSPGSSTDSSAKIVGSADVSAPGTAGMRVFLDPETGDVSGEPGPNAVIELDAETQNALRYDDEGLVFVTHPNGAVSVNVQERYQNASFVRIDENGKHIFCNSNAAAVERSMSDTTPTTPEVK